jgi:hypothetical protein
MELDVLQLQNELRQRHGYPYVWSKKQDNGWDELTRFIYYCDSFRQLKHQISLHLIHLPDFKKLAYYAINRWYNFKSAQAVESFFCQHTMVSQHATTFHKEIDFYIHHIPFDHKTSVFPMGFKNDLKYAKKHPIELAHWLYSNQSTEQRHHLKNRIFIVLHARNGEHWKLKSELVQLKKMVDHYLSTFSVNQLLRLTINEQTVLTDVLFLTED